MTKLRSLIISTPFRWSLIYLLSFLVIVGGVTGTLLWRTNDLLTSQVLETIRAEVDGFRQQYRIGGPDLLERSVTERGLGGGNGLYFLREPRGGRIAGNLRRMPDQLPTDGGSALFRYHPPGAIRSAARERLAAGVSVRVADGSVLLVGRDIEDQREFLAGLRRVLLWSIGLVAFAGLAGGYLLSRKILGRIDAVATTSERIMGGDLSERIARDGSGDELDRLGARLNQMLERIERLVSAMREVTDNIAHDLKTPLNRLRNSVEAALRDPRGEPAYREALERTIEEADSLIKTFNALLSIARLESGAAGDNMTSVDLTRLVEDLFEFYEPVAEDAGLAIRISRDGPAVVRGDRQLLGQAVANLIENALKYGHATRPGAGPGAISVRVEHRGGQALISVGDRGPGIPADQRGRVVERFVRLEGSRSQPGSGLGLSLVAAIAHLHGGAFRLEDNDPGLRAVLSLPGLAAEPGESRRPSTRAAAAGSANSDRGSGRRNDGATLASHWRRTAR